ncbi:MAG TPA: FCD domain-containing protein [Solirubrobacteraceae bacterium]|nr:FCD domain-containing protein [Solirubrobacteraceae bacterium]
MSDPVTVPPAPRFSVVHTDASERIAHEIARYIDRNGLGPGDRIGTEAELAREFGVSRATLREGVRLLAGSRLTRSSQGRGGGIFVANTLNQSMGRHMSETIAIMLSNSNGGLPQIMEMRRLLESAGAELAASRADADAIAALHDSVEKMAACEVLDDAFADADISFHQIISAATGNELLIALTSWTQDVLVPTLVARLRPVVGTDEIVDQHRAVLRAIRRRRPAAAARAMTQHMLYLEELVLALDPAPAGT